MAFSSNAANTHCLNDENRRITPRALTNPNLTLQLYGADARNIQVTSHNGIPDLWKGFTTSPVVGFLGHEFPLRAKKPIERL